MPQLDIYRAFDEIIIILLLIGIIYLMFILIVLPLLIKRIGLIKNQQEIQQLILWTLQINCLHHNLHITENSYLFKNAKI